jgi:hypothetical protein
MLLERLRRLVKQPDVRALFVLAGFTLLVFFSGAAMQGVYFYGDASDYFARLAFTAERVRAGALPLWNPYLSLGGTQAGDPAALTWYLPALVLFQILPHTVAFNYTLILHIFWSAAGMYVLARSWGLERTAALIASVAYGFSGFSIAHFQHLNILVGVSWLPWIFWCIEKFFVTDRAAYLGWGALALGMQLLGGHTQTVLYGAVAWGAYSVLRLVRALRAGERRAPLKQALALVLMLLAASGIAAIFLVPFVELLAFISRGERVTYEYATSFSLEPIRLAAFVSPFLFGGNPGSVERGAGSLIEMSAYVGVLPLALAALALTRRDRRVLFLAGLAAVGLVLALGKYTPFYSLVYALPLFGSVRAPARLLEVVTFALALLSGFGYERLRQRASSQLFWVLLFSLGALVVLPAALFIAPRAGFVLSPTLAGAASNRAVLLAGGFALGAGGILLLWRRRVLPERALAGLTVLLIAADLGFFAVSFRYNYPAPFQVYATPGKSAREIQRDRNRANVFFWGLGETKLATYLQRGDLAGYMGASRAGLRQSLPLHFRIHSMQGYGSEPPAYAALVQRIEASGEFDENAARRLARFGGQTILSPRKLESPALRLVERNGGISLFDLRLEGGRVAFASRALSVSSPGDALAAFDDVPRGLDTVALQVPSAESFAPTTGTAEYLTDDPEYVALSVRLENAPAYLVLNDTFYPGWRVLVDGQPAPLYRANGLVRAVPVPQGSHRVEFIYDPASVRMGAIVSLVSLALVVAFIVWSRRTGAP